MPFFDDPLKLEHQICFPLYLCSRELTRRYKPFLDKLDLTYMQYLVMLYLWEHKRATVGEIGRTLLTDTNTLTPLLKKLEEKEYIVRERSAADERSVEIALTNTGAKLKNHAKKIPFEMGQCLRLKPEEAETLHVLLHKALNHLGRNSY